MSMMIVMTDRTDVTAGTARLIHNERVKLTTDFLSRTGLWVIVVGFLPMFLQGQTTQAICWLVGGLTLGIGMNIAAFLNIRRII
jgi:Na+-transporting NADH:ubiquinone oxidoreductase subunit NqrC